MLNDQEKFSILRKLDNKNGITSQRALADELGFSLGKLNYCLKALKHKGLIKFDNFKKNKKKTKYFYILTPAGITIKTRMTVNFMKRKMREYDELKNELKKLKQKNSI